MKEAGAESLSFQLLNRNVDQPLKYLATWLIDERSKIGLHVTQRVVPMGPPVRASFPSYSRRPAQKLHLECRNRSLFSHEPTTLESSSQLPGVPRVQQRICAVERRLSTLDPVKLTMPID